MTGRSAGRAAAWGRGAVEEDDTEEGAEDDGEDRAEGGRGEGRDQGGGEGEGETAGVGGERALHGEDGLGDNGDGDQLQAVQNAGLRAGR